MSWSDHGEVLLINSGELVGAPSRNPNRNEGQTTEVVTANRPTDDSFTRYFIQHQLTKHTLFVSLCSGSSGVAKMQVRGRNLKRQSESRWTAWEWQTSSRFAWRRKDDTVDLRFLVAVQWHSPDKRQSHLKSSVEHRENVKGKKEGIF